MVGRVTPTSPAPGPGASPDPTSRKYAHLATILAALVAEGLVVAFSGGVDSAFLLWAARQQQRTGGGRLLALTAVSPSMARAERDDARAFAAQLDVEHVWQESHELENPAYALNDSRRCYHCKNELFRICREVATGASRVAGGYRWLAYGYNASDRHDVRPGHEAAIEHGVRSPLAEAGLEKDDIRALMRSHGLDLADKPASPCLSSRLMRGVRVTPDRLSDVEQLEALLRARGLRVFRVRVHEVGARSLLRVEVAPEELSLAFGVREELVAAGCARGYDWVTLDLAGYRVGGGAQ